MSACMWIGNVNQSNEMMICEHYMPWTCYLTVQFEYCSLWCGCECGCPDWIVCHISTHILDQMSCSNTYIFDWMSHSNTLAVWVWVPWEDHLWLLHSWLPVILILRNCTLLLKWELIFVNLLIRVYYVLIFCCVFCLWE